jgi:WD40 repeat protein
MRCDPLFVNQRAKCLAEVNGGRQPSGAECCHRLHLYQKADAHRSPRVLIVGLLLCLCAVTPLHAQGEKQAVPSAAAQAQALQRLQAEQQAEFAEAKTERAARQKLASVLLSQAYEKKDTVERFVRLQQACQLASSAGDVTTALAAVDELVHGYQVAERSLRLDTLTTLAEHVPDAEQAKTLTDLVLRQLSEAVTEDDYDTAGELGKVADQAARKTKYLPLVLDVRRQQRGIELAHQQFEQLEPVAEQLKQKPTDPQANRQMGEYLCLLKGDWERGLFLLAQGDDPTLRRLAQRDLVAPQQTPEQLDLGHRWWELASKKEGLVKTHLQQRAVYWYEQAIHEQEGETRELLQRRIAATPTPRRHLAPWDYSGQPGLIRVLGQHNSNVYGVAFSPDGRTLLSGSIDSQAALWDASTGKKLHALQGHQGMLWSVAFGARGKYAFTASWDGTIKMWETRSGKSARQFPSAGRLADVNGIDVSADGRFLLAGCDDSRVHLWDIQTGKELKALAGHQGFVYGVAFSPDGRQALSGGATDNTMILWDLQTGKAVRRFQGIGGQLRTVAFSPDGRKAICAGEATLRLWDLQAGREIQRFQGHTAQTYAVAFSPDGRRLITGGADNTIRYWDVASGRELHIFRGHNSAIFSLAFSPGGGRVVSGSADNTVRLWGLPH